MADNTCPPGRSQDLHDRLKREHAFCQQVGISWYDLTKGQKRCLHAGETVEMTDIQRSQYGPSWPGPRLRGV